MKLKKLILFTGLILALFFLSGTSVLAADTVSDTPFQIGSAADFNLFAQAVNESSTNTFIIGTGEAAVTYTDAILSDNITFDDSAPLIPAGVYASAEDTSQNHPFTGTFDGNDKTITVESIDSSAQEYEIFGYLNGAKITKLKVVDKNYDSFFLCVGGIAGMVENNSLIENCSVSGTVSASGSFVGGIVGYIDGNTIKNATVSATVFDKNNSAYTGGISGYANNTSIENCLVTNSVTGYLSAGGITGGTQGSCSITDCSVSASVTGSSAVGGIAGDFAGGNISNCSVTGSVTGQTASGYPVNTGGIAGSSTNGNITNCTVTDTVTGYTNVGGIVGTSSGGSINNCNIKNTVSGSTNVGGIVGTSSGGSITNCNITYSVSGDTNVGGIAGISSNSTITNCCVSAYIYGSSVAGIAGDGTGSTINNVYYRNTISAGVGEGSYTGSVTAVTTDQFASGEIAWALQNPDKQTPTGTAQSGLVWGQTGATPELTTDSAKQVYQLTINKVDGTSDISYHNAGYTFVLDPAKDGCAWVDGNDQEVTESPVTLSGDMTINEAIQTPTLSAEKTVINQTETAGLYIEAPESFSGIITSCRYQIDGDNWSDPLAYTDATTAIPINNLTTGSHTISVQVKTDNSPWSQAASVDIYVLAVSDSTIQIDTPQAFNAFATYINNGWEGDPTDPDTIDDAVLTADLSFDSSAPLIPIGLSDTYPYSGSFDGQNYTITVNAIDDTSNYLGLFGYTTDASIQNIKTDGTITFIFSIEPFI
ncbi:GLUG motif-containing protein [Eubacteriaceae bacterium ES2]|nr:GLUG motif-containing protein [Eubacteriaceae bacterium ES2]